MNWWQISTGHITGLLPALKQNGLKIITSHENLTRREAIYVDKYFEEVVYPVLDPDGGGFVQTLSADSHNLTLPLW